MEVKVSVKITAKDMFDFMIKHTYSTFSGYVGVIISICAFLGFVALVDNEAVSLSYKLVLLATSLMFTVIQPLMLYSKSKKQVEKNENINKPLEYTIDSSRIHITQGEDSAEYTWDQVLKITSTKNCIFLYVSKYRSFILPKRLFEENGLETLRELARKNAVNAKSITFGRI